MALEEEEETQNAPFCMLFCEEESISVFEEDESVVKSPSFHLGFPDHDMLWDDDELLGLISKQDELKPCLSDKALDEFKSLCRENALGWIFRVKGYYGFSSLTALLAVNYFDRFITSRKFQTDKPWMSQLTAVACLSLAAKVEEIRVPLLLDLQVGEARYVFEAKTIQRMELLILSTLQWRMHPVTPISFFDHIIRRYSFNSHEFFSRCESLLLSIVHDSRFLSYTPSVLATAIMVSVARDFKEAEYESQLMTLLKVDPEKVNKCYELVLDHNPSKKRMMHASLSSDGSNESWVVSSEPLYKRRRVHEQQMKLSSINRMFLDVFTSSSPR
ncbi:hypothetical protein HID58_077549 [Brassica napus]|uniref:BnaC07g31650D protein n=2 Tax=Brassica napus TaxID=3708 RepID=A0A078GDD5_BRANA|nr:cyclin-D3-3 [Brassica napus]KAH0870527.1 hypothetical protein HID58_077549 [Brassica napus]CAF2018488.1 unnamed protein product [Brassica napus]CDY23022.1 BnaC07g31650D [Brassica napus]